MSGIWAHHAHVFPESVRPAGTIDQLLRLMDACGIEKAVAFSPFAHQLRDDGAGRNRWLASEIARHDRFIGFGTIDFEHGDVVDQVKEISDLGLRGIKLHPAAQKVSVVDEAAMKVYEAAAERGLFLTFHTGIHWHRLSDYHVLLFDEIAYRFPSLRFSLEHVGGYHFLHDALAVILNNSRKEGDRRVSNVYGGLTSVFDREKHKHWYFSLDLLQEIVWQVGAHQLIFGLDFPYNGEEETKGALAVIEALGLTPEEKELILGGTLRRVLGV